MTTATTPTISDLERKIDELTAQVAFLADEARQTKQRRQVFPERIGLKAHFSDRAMHCAGAIGPISHLARLGVLDRTRHIGTDRANLRIRH